jgi:hypothetical protein
MKEWNIWKRPPSEKSAKIIFYVFLLLIISLIVEIVFFLTRGESNATYFALFLLIMVFGLAGAIYPLYKQFIWETIDYI